MKKYLFGLGAMLVGAGLMFVLTHTEVSAEDKREIDLPDIIGQLIKPHSFSHTHLD